MRPLRQIRKKAANEVVVERSRPLLPSPARAQTRYQLLPSPTWRCCSRLRWPFGVSCTAKPTLSSSTSHRFTSRRSLTSLRVTKDLRSGLGMSRFLTKRLTNIKILLHYSFSYLHNKWLEGYTREYYIQQKLKNLN